GKCDIAFENLVSVAADLYVWTVAVKGLDPVGHAWVIVVRAVSVVSTARALVGSGLMTPVLLRQLCRMEPDGLLRHVIYLIDHNGGVSCGFIVCDRSSGGSWFCNVRRPRSINSKSIMAKTMLFHLS